MMVRVSGSEKPALTCALCSQCIGPTMVLLPSVADGIDWGPTTCLKDTTRELKLTNDSLIPAPFRCYFKNPKSVFRVDINRYERNCLLVWCHWCHWCHWYTCSLTFSIFHFPFSIFHFPFSIFHFPFSIFHFHHFPFSIFHFHHFRFANVFTFLPTSSSSSSSLPLPPPVACWRPKKASH
jgi:hypothetical protein